MRIALNGNEDISDLEATESGILDAMAAFEAKTLDGLRVKAEAIKALYPDDDIRDAIAEGGTIARLASSVLADLVKMDFSIFHVSESGIKQSRE